MSEKPKGPEPEGVIQFKHEDVTLEISTDIRIHYKKSESYRTIYANGAIGGMSGMGHITMCLFHERAPIPKSVLHRIQDDGQLGVEVEREALDGIVREIDTEVILSIDSASVLAAWLQGKVREARERLDAIQTIQRNPDSVRIVRLADAEGSEEVASE